ncbi:hypothetical protein [Mycobacterium sp. P7213]|uniref:hypothetical protein n=1 Tax=Mycobacterium sp. P7213 TaxID=2478465 RepID=UPI001F154526|nr:hypothetical protein [Mycobacterium sp. P7213]
MDIFRVHKDLIDDYRLFTTSAIEPRDPRVSQHVQDELARQAQWPEPWLSLNPMFASGGSIDALVAEGLLHPECEEIFRPKRHIADVGTAPITLHRHQREAIETARSGNSYVLTTGTGSGKSLAVLLQGSRRARFHRQPLRLRKCKTALRRRASQFQVLSAHPGRAGRPRSGGRFRVLRP